MDEAALVEKIIDSRTFRSSDSLGPLLQFLFKNRHRKIQARDIETLLFGHEDTSRHFDPARSRQQVMKLKDFLERYSTESPEDDLVCSIPSAKDRRGYYVEFKKVQAGFVACSSFWEAHFAGRKNTAIVCDSLLFFYEHSQGRMLRYVDTNIEGTSRTLARKELDRLHPSHESEKLSAGHFYVDVGAVVGADMLREHFWKIWDRRIAMFIEKEEKSHEWMSGSPVLLSTSRTNTFAKRIFASDEARALNYRIHPDRFAWAIISNPTSEEKKRLGKVSGLEWGDKESFTTTAPEQTLGIVTRMPNPVGGGGVLTFISSDATRNATQMVAALTEEAQLRKLMDKMKWPYSRPLPEKLEMLFLVKLWPGNLDDKASEAELLCWRSSGEKPSEFSEAQD
jgi:hypothetical protein